MVSPDLLEKLAAYVPTPVAYAIYQRPRHFTEPTTRRFPAAVLLADISGFTQLSELLSQTGRTGAEELTQIINQYFTLMIQLLEAYRGQVVKFSGDAIIALFPAEDISLQTATRRAGECALSMQAQMSAFTDLHTSQGHASLSMKASLGAGQVLECSIGGVVGRWEYVVGGDPLVQVAVVEGQAQPGQIVVSPQAWSQIQAYFRGEKKPHTSGTIRLHRVLTPLLPMEPMTLDWTRLDSEQRELAQRALEGYLPAAIKARLDEQAGWLAELRRMTILFVGIGNIDYEAEEAGERLQNLLQATQELIHRFEGSLGKLTVDDKGTVVLILFGVPPFSHEDDATRAVAFALSLQSVAREQHLRMAIGITEGPVFAGPVGAPDRREYTVIGDEVNLAARLMQYGRAGTIIVSERVKKRAGSHFITESLGQIALKGKTTALPAYLVKGEQGAQDQFMTRYLLYDNPLVGRKPELEQTRRVAARARAGDLQLLLVESELGLGKTRLVSEMVREWVMEGGAGYGSKCISYGQQIPYQAWREILVAIFGLTPNLSSEHQLARLAIGVANLEEPSQQPDYWAVRLPLLSDVMGLEIPQNDFTRYISGELRRNNTFALIEALLRQEARRRPLLIVLEDVHWADELSLALAAHLTATLADERLLLVMTLRQLTVATELPLPAELRGLSCVSTLRLNPLSDEESLDLIKITLRNQAILPDVQQILLSRGQGNPFFLQEISRAILDVMENQADRLSELLERLDLPDTVHDAILMHVDRLPEPEKLTLKVAAVIGIRFQRSLLSTVHPINGTRPQLPAQLQELENENLIRMETSAPKWEYVFRNVITQEIVYEGLLLAQRRQLHAAVGAALQNEAPDAIENLAYHYSRSNDWEMAVHYLKMAGQKASREYANHAAIGYYSEILARLAERSDNDRANGFISADYWDLLLERSKLYNLTGHRDKEVEDLGTLGLIAEVLDDDRRRALAAKQWSSHYESIGDYASAMELIERSVQLAQQAGDERLEGEGYNRWGKLLHIFRDYDTAQRHLQRAFRIAQRYHDQSAQADCLNNLGLAAYFQADYDVAQYFFDEAVDLRRSMGDQLGLGHGLRFLGQVYLDTGRFTDALKCFNESLRRHAAIGDPHGEALTRQKLGELHRRVGRYDEARLLFQQALPAYRSAGDERAEVHTIYQLGFLHCRMGEYEAALGLLGQALARLQEEFEDPVALGKTLIYYSWTLIELGRFKEARLFLQEAMKTESNLHHEATLIDCAVQLGRIALARNDLNLARTCARHAVAFVDKHGAWGLEHPALVYLTSYHILEATQESSEAQLVLQQAQHYLEMQAAQIEDPQLRHSYLTQIQENREIQALTG